MNIIEAFKKAHKPLKLENIKEPDLDQLRDQVNRWVKARFMGKCS